MGDDDQEPTDPAGDDRRAVTDALAELSRKLDTVAGAVAAIAGGHTDLLGHVAEAEARRTQDSLGIAQRLDALERQVLGLARAEPGAAADLAERLERIEHQLSVLPGAAPGVETTFVALADRLAAVAEAEPERQAALARLTELAESTAQRIGAWRADSASGGEASEGLDAVQAQLGSLLEAQQAIAAELAALGPRVNELLDRHPDGLPLPPPPPAPVYVPDEVTSPPTAELALAPLQAQVANLEVSAASQRDDLALSLEVLARVAEAVERLDARTEDRLAAVRDAATAPLADLEALLSARGERTEARFEELATALRDLAARPEPTAPADDDRPANAAAAERVDEMATAVQSLTWQLPEMGDELAGRVTEHTDAALAGVLRLIDDRLTALRSALAEAEPGPTATAAASGMGGFEAGAVMGAAQAAWNRLEQRLDSEFDDLGRQLQAMASLIEGVVHSTEDLANRPVVTGDQLRRAASAVKDSVVSASRSRRERRGGPRGLGSGH